MLSRFFARISRNAVHEPTIHAARCSTRRGHKFQMTAAGIPKKRSYGIAKRWLFALVALLIVFSLYTVFTPRGPRPAMPTNHPTPEPLGSPEDATKLWYPFVGDNF
jgi:hypothetical protein